MHLFAVLECPEIIGFRVPLRAVADTEFHICTHARDKPFQR